MIINCDNCNKKFSLNDSQIPLNGRLLECGYCKNRWFFKASDASSKEVINSDNNIIKTENNNKNEENLNISINKDVSDKNLSSNDKDTSKNEINNSNKLKKKKKNNYSLKNYLNNSLIILITFCAIIIIVDTFKIPISNFLPGIIPLLDNLYATITDLHLFLKDLLN